MAYPTLAWVLLTAVAACAADKVSPQAGDVVLETHFSNPTERQAWPQAGFAKWVTSQDGTTALCIAAPSGSAEGSHMVSLPLDLERFRGCRLQFECRLMCAANAGLNNQPTNDWLATVTDRRSPRYAGQAERPY